MAKKIPDYIMDLSLDGIANAGNVIHACSDEPANYAGIAAVTLGNTTLSTGVGAGDYTKGDGDVSGRKLTLALQTITASGTGSVNHAVIADSNSSEIVAIATMSSFAVSSAVDFNIAQYDVWEIRDPSTST